MELDDLFSKPRAIDLSFATCLSGGAAGADTVFENISSKYGCTVKAFSYKTPYHKSVNKVEISEADFKEGVLKIKKANKVLQRYNIEKYINLLARNWAQVKYSDQVFAISTLVHPNKKGGRGFINQSKYTVVDGGTGYACQMCIDAEKELFVFDQIEKTWFIWDPSVFKFKPLSDPLFITKYDFTGIGTRELNDDGYQAIEDLFLTTQNKFLKL